MADIPIIKQVSRIQTYLFGNEQPPQRTPYTSFDRSITQINPQAQATIPVMEPFTTPIYAWYDASDSSSIQLDTNNNVLAWNDKSGYNNHLINSVLRPTYNNRTHNGLNVVNFQTDGQYITCANINLPQTDLSYYIVCQVDSNTVNSLSDAILSMRDVASENTWQLTSYNSTQFFGAMSRGNVEREILQYGNVDLSGEYHIFEITFDNARTTDTIYLDGLYKASVGNKPAAIQNGGQLAVFRNRARNNFAQGAVAEVMCVGSVSDKARQQVEGYLAWKWNLTSKLPQGHPYKYNYYTL